MATTDARDRGTAAGPRLVQAAWIALAYLPAVLAVMWGVPALTAAQREGAVTDRYAAAAEPPDLSRMNVASPRPVDNDCSGGFVYFTFDDGPFVNTRYVLDHLRRLNLKATFYVVGDRAREWPDLIRREVREGHSVQNHTFSHPDLVLAAALDGASGRLLPWQTAEVRTQLVRANRAIVAAGAPRPTQYRPPFGSVNRRVDAVARDVGLRLVMPWSEADEQILDSGDVAPGSTPADITRTVTSGLHPGTIVVMHDGSDEPTLNSLYALQPIVDAMNERRLCSSTQIPGGTSGGALRVR